MTQAIAGHRPRWAVLRRYDIPDLLDPSTTYLTRWRLLETPWFGVFVHAIRLPDSDPHLHDHPWSFVALILRGGYEEVFAPDLSSAIASEGAAPLPTTERRRWGPGSMRVVPKRTFHAIRRLSPKPTWTIMFVGPRRQEWGFATPGGWVHHDDYVRSDRAPSVCLRRR